MIVWPKIPPAILALAPTITGWADVTVYNGEPVPRPSDGRYFIVGLVTDETSAGTFNQEPGTVDGLRDESGEVRCELAIGVGESDVLDVVLSDAYVLLNALDAALRADETLGGVLTGASFVTLAGDFVPIKSNGTAVRVPLSIQYFAQTP